jgi:D-arabinose 1-dehydrogenase-like Zn-dependent alcohol dehydrogenase
VSDRILAAVMPAPERPIEIREYARPDLPTGAALLRTARSEVCGTDVHLWHGRLSGVPYPIIPGHVSTGVLEAVRGPLRGLDGARLSEGDRAVFFDVHRTCGSARAFEEGPYLARDGGRYIVAGHYTDAGLSSVNVHTAINRKHLDIRGCWGSEPAHFLRALTVLERLGPDVPFDAIGERTYPLDRLDEALADAESMRITKALVDPWAAA